MQFSYKARNKEGAIVTGVVDAANRTEAIDVIRDSGATPVTVEEKKSFSFSSATLFKRVRLEQKIIFTKNLSGMLRSGLALSRALTVLVKQTTNPYFKTIITMLIETIDKGGTLSEGMAKYPDVFSSLFVAMIKAGEESGGLDGALSEIGINLEKSYNLNRKIKGALMYPAIILIAIIIIAILMFIFVVPTLTKTFTELGVKLPWSTQLIISTSNIFVHHSIAAFSVIGGIVFAAIILSKQKPVQRKIDYITVRLPVIGTLIQEMNSARTARTLSSLLSSGVAIGRAIVITKEVLQNVYYKEVMDEVEKVIEQGESMSKVFQRNTALYPIMVGEMMEVGEETGKLSNMLLDIALFYEGEVEEKTKDLSTIIEPILMVFVGAGVGFFAISMLTPIYSVMDNIK